jgi:hypothetical protein
MISGGIIASIGAAAASWLLGDVVGILLGRSGVAGFGGSAAKILRVGRLKKAIYDTDPTAQARSDLLAWCDANNDDATRHGLRPVEPTS